MTTPRPSCDTDDMAQVVTVDARFGRVRTIARRLGCGEHALRAAIRRGNVPTYQPPGAWPLVSIVDAEAWLRAQRVEPTARARRRVDEIIAREARRAG